MSTSYIFKQIRNQKPEIILLQKILTIEENKKVILKKPEELQLLKW